MPSRSSQQRLAIERPAFARLRRGSLRRAALRAKTGGRQAWREMTWIGVIVAVVTYGLGLAFGSLG